MRGKRILLSGVLLVSFIYLYGCETVKGAGGGIACTTAGTVEGIGKDTKNTYDFIQATDNWIRKNLW
ncbi:MAG: hypothetical protein A3K83_01380 [Omnitrophica WOR_2 bacterium RBG_13_44_8b]|nr:MAG: hypothetical protein A3K83_01380 [Omnitrophica WOR_2 bacterium RBG_13_44_8b]